MHAWQGSDGVELTVIDQLTVDFISEHPHLRVLAQNLGNRFQVGFGDDAACRILRRIQNQELGFGCDFVGQLLRVKTKIAGLTQVNRHTHRAIGFDLRVVNRETWHGVNDFVTGTVVGDRLNGVTDEGLGTCTHHHIVGVHLNATGTRKIVSRGLAQLRDTC